MAPTVGERTRHDGGQRLFAVPFQTTRAGAARGFPALPVSRRRCTVSSTAEKMGLFSDVADEKALANTVDRFREQKILLPTFAQLADPSTIPSRIWEAISGVGPDDPDPRNLWRVHWYNDSTRADHTDVPEYLEIPTGAVRRRCPHPRGVGQSIPHDQGSQGAGRLRLPGSAHRHRRLRPHPPPGHLALDGQLRPWRRCHQPVDGLPRRRSPPGRDEPGAIPLAGGVDLRTRGHHQDLRCRVQCQRDLRRLQ